MRSTCLDLRRELEALTPEAHEVVRDARHELEMRLTRLQRKIEVESARLGE
jgi:hypothetical protein